MDLTTRFADFDLAAREAAVVGDGPRITPLTGDTLSEAEIAMILAVRAGAGAGPMDEVPEYMRVLIRHKELFRGQMELGAILYNGLIPPREREIAVLRVGWLCRAPYEWGQHVNIAKRAGLTSEHIEWARIGSGAQGWTEHERAIVRGVEELIGDAAVSDETWTVLQKGWDAAQLLEFPAIVGQYVSIAYMQNSVRIPLDAGNPGLFNR